MLQIMHNIDMLYFVFTVFIYPNGDKSMNGIFKLFSCLSVILFLLITACTAPKVTDNWMDEAYKESKIEKVLVIGAAKKITFRNLFEGMLVEQLNQKGIEAIPSYTLIQPDKMLSKKTILKTVEKHNIDAVIITVLADRQEKTKYYSAPSVNYFNFYSSVYGVYGPLSRAGAKSYEVSILFLKTNLYDVKTEKLIWTITSESELQYNIDSMEAATELIIESLAKDGFIK
jgi:hypothetical protein